MTAQSELVTDLTYRYIYILTTDQTSLITTQWEVTVSYMRVVVGCNVDYTNSDDVGKQNSNGRIEDNKILVEFIAPRI